MSVPAVFWPFRQDEESHEHHRHPAFPRRIGVTGDVGMKLCVPFDGNEDHFHLAISDGALIAGEYDTEDRGRRDHAHRRRHGDGRLAAGMGDDRRLSARAGARDSAAALIRDRLTRSALIMPMPPCVADRPFGRSRATRRP